MAMTLLEMVQSIMSSMDSDSVNSISDTDESLQVAGYLKDSYYELISGLDLPNTFTIFQLNSSGDPLKPTLMTLPSGYSNIQWLRYNKQALNDVTAVQAEPPGFYSLANGNASFNYDTLNSNNPPGSGPNDALGPPLFFPVHFMPLERFLQRMYTVGSNLEQTYIENANGTFTPIPNPGNPSVLGFSPPVDEPFNFVGSFQLKTEANQNMTIYYRNDRAPLYFTTFDDKTILFDSYDGSVDSTLQGAKTVCYGEKLQIWEMIDTFIPNINDKQVSLLINEAKQQAFIEAKQSSNPLATQRAHKGWVRARRTKGNITYGENSRAKTTTHGFGRNTWPMPNTGTFRDHEPN